MGFDEQSTPPILLPMIISSNPNHKNNNPPLSSQPKTFANVFIAIVGAGVLGLPYAFRRTGWLTSLLILAPVAALTYHCMMLLVRTRRKLETEEDAKITSFGDLGSAVCGPFGRAAVDFMIVFSQSGFCVGYLIFIANSLANLHNLVPKASYIWACFPFQLALNSIPTLTHLAPLSIFADVIDLAAMGTVMADDVAALNHSRPPVNAFGDWSTLFYGIGVAVYAFEGIGMVLPLESETENKESFGKILALSMSFITLLYASFGLLGYFAFGESTQDIITANLGRGPTSTLVQLGLCLNLFFTFPLMMNPVYEVVERRFSRGRRHCLSMRWGLVMAVSLAALLVPNFADFLSLVGSSFGCALAFVLPALFHAVVFWEELGVTGLAFDGCIVLMGVFFGVCGTWHALLEIFSAKV